ncbi:MAG: DUF1524 domain-containing protein [Sulfurovum sp.]|nr:DUF1524 domain-containing protein [Sulfurovum sp.]
MESNKKSKREKLLNRINIAIKSEKIDEFDSLQDDIFNTFGMSEIHTIDNLALLSNKNNSALNNNIFPKKRDIIIQKDKAGEFIPICTKNVFLKYYSKDISKLYFWKDRDREEYILEMKDVIENFLGEIND